VNPEEVSVRVNALAHQPSKIVEPDNPVAEVLLIPDFHRPSVVTGRFAEHTDRADQKGSPIKKVVNRPSLAAGGFVPLQNQLIL